MRSLRNLILVAAGLGLTGLTLAACKTPAPTPASGDTTAMAQPAAAVPAAQPTPGGAPRLEAAEKVVEVGSVRQGEKATHTFVLKNVGTDVLHIKKAKGS